MVSDQWEVIKCRPSGEALGLLGPEEPLPLRMITFGGDEWAVSSTVVAFHFLKGSLAAGRYPKGGDILLLGIGTLWILIVLDILLVGVAPVFNHRIEVTGQNCQ